MKSPATYLFVGLALIPLAVSWIDLGQNLAPLAHLFSFLPVCADLYLEGSRHSLERAVDFGLAFVVVIAATLATIWWPRFQLLAAQRRPGVSVSFKTYLVLLVYLGLMCFCWTSAAYEPGAGLAGGIAALSDRNLLVRGLLLAVVSIGTYFALISAYLLLFNSEKSK